MDIMNNMDVNSALYKPIEKLGQQAANLGKDSDGQKPGEVLQQFGDVLKNYIGDVNNVQNEASKTVEAYATGEPVELHQVMVAMDRAELSMQVTSELRNKMIQAYQDITRMPI